MDRFLRVLIEMVGYLLNLGIEAGLILGIIWLLRPLTNRLLSPRQRYWLWALGWFGATFHFFFKMLDWINIFPVTLRDFLIPGGQDRDVYHLYLPVGDRAQHPDDAQNQPPFYPQIQPVTYHFNQGTQKTIHQKPPFAELRAAQPSPMLRSMSSFSFCASSMVSLRPLRKAVRKGVTPPNLSASSSPCAWITASRLTSVFTVAFSF